MGGLIIVVLWPLVLMIAWEIFLVLVSGAYVIWRPEFLKLF